ncbi:hypothetical protein [Archaeoglobus profundus]|uniref:Uncharacterized protein n=1 Tax=Archaeoglobus profundus (strain DSM 5631 / JCM 9629 / NBRC 100127 / Av18) TaxID=572546 RepID=D2RI37_ARCPA|nr:hypothetical protein [Archaeoglobus profundus]ADB57962.1 hypothetical protein Arcpr_0901 [Archaeoglobus profundus DSM 5631]
MRKKNGWRKGLFKENSVCVVCGKPLGRVGKLCDLCAVKLYITSIITGKPIKEVVSKYDLDYKAFTLKIQTMKKEGSFANLFFKAVEIIKQDYMGR